VGLDLKVLASSKFLWEKIVREAPHIQNKIAPMMRAHSSKIKSDIVSYEAHIKEYKAALTKAEYYLYATGTRKAMELLEAAEQAHAREKQTCDKMTHIANVFECLKEMDASIRLMSEVADLLSDFKVMWEANQRVNTVVEDARRIAWSKLDAEGLEDSAKGLVQSLRKLPKSVRQSDAFQGMDKAVKEFVITCPIITSLRSPAMRERHWRELMEVVKKQFALPSSKPQMPLQDLLDLQLHKHANEVDEITEKASKEAKHEDTLANLEATWSAVNFTMSFYKDTDVPLLKLEDDMVEQLEADQMAVQSIVGSRYGHFKKEAAEWQRTLGLVSDVSQLLTEIQRTWSYLEPLFVGSEEVRKELPDDANRFQEVDTQVKAILQKGWKIRNVKAICQQPGLLEKLHELESEQDRCKKSLSDFLDGKRRQFPRFYFTSEADLLDILSNSSQPSKVLDQVDKILLATKSLTTELRSGEDRPHALNFVAGVGKETVPFDPPVKLVGKAEQYLRALLDAQIFTLSKCLAASMARYPQMLRVEWVTQKDTKTGEAVDPAQIILLVATIDFVQQVEKSMAQATGGDPKSVVKCFELVKAQLADLITLTQAALSKADRQRVMCMITTDAHNRDILDVLLKEKALAATDFQWQSKLRPSFVGKMEKGVTHIVSTARFDICDARFEYGFEYLGNGPRLVITPLTDRIYVTATQALNLKMGCAPAGKRNCVFVDIAFAKRPSSTV
jgi:dynein heavy chain